jgi:hypothetical protein
VHYQGRCEEWPEITDICILILIVLLDGVVRKRSKKNSRRRLGRGPILHVKQHGTEPEVGEVTAQVDSTVRLHRAIKNKTSSRLNYVSIGEFYSFLSSMLIMKRDIFRNIGFNLTLTSLIARKSFIARQTSSYWDLNWLSRGWELERPIRIFSSKLGNSTNSKYYFMTVKLGCAGSWRLSLNVYTSCNWSH